MSDEKQIAVIENNPLAIIANAVDKGFDAEQLGKLVDLHLKIDAMNAKRAYDEAMNNCQKEMPLVVRDGFNKETQKKFASAEWTQHLCKPIYSRHGFSLSFGTEPSQVPDHYTVYCDVKHARGHQERYTLSGIPNDSTGPKGAPTKSKIQGMMSSMMYAQGRLTRMIFSISTADEDADGAGVDPTLNEDQVKMIEKLARDQNYNMALLLKWANVVKLADMPQRLFVNARDFLQDRLKKQQEGGGQ